MPQHFLHAQVPRFPNFIHKTRTYSLCLPSLFAFVAASSHMSNNSALLALSLPLSPRDFFVHECVGHSTTLLPAGCCHLIFVEQYHSLLFHLSLFSFMAFFQTLLFFQRFFLLSGDHETEQTHLVHGYWAKKATAANASDKPIQLCSSSSPKEEEKNVCFSFIRHPFFTNSTYCQTLAIEITIHDFGL